jgi:hypothetical protein
VIHSDIILRLLDQEAFVVRRSSKSEKLDHDAMIHFRPGESFGRLLSQFAQSWDVSKNEAARRLALMSAFGLGADLYPDIAAAAQQLGGSRSFEQACQHLRGVLDGALLERKSRNLPLADSDAREVVAEAVQMLCSRFQLKAGSSGKQASMIALQAPLRGLQCDKEGENP